MFLSQVIRVQHSNDLSILNISIGLHCISIMFKLPLPTLFTALLKEQLFTFHPADERNNVLMEL